LDFNYLRPDGLEKKNRKSRLGASPSSGGHATAAVIAATGVADYKLFGFRRCRILAVMNSLAEAACARRRRCGSQRHGDEISREREKQQQSGGQAMHAFCWNKNPSCGQHRTTPQTVQAEGPAA
jgi:hypothetical protein